MCNVAMTCNYYTKDLFHKLQCQMSQYYQHAETGNIEFLLEKIYKLNKSLKLHAPDLINIMLVTPAHDLNMEIRSDEFSFIIAKMKDAKREAEASLRDAKDIKDP